MRSSSLYAVESGGLYLDHNATTPVDESVLDAMLPYLRSRFANPSSGHRMGRLVREAIATAREQVASLVGAHPSQVIFTGGGSEANNLALRGGAATQSPRLVAIGATEHASVMQSAAHAAQSPGTMHRTIPVDGSGVIMEHAIHEALHACGKNPSLISIMLANNETGVLQDLQRLVPLIQEISQDQCIVHSDAVQAAGKVAIDFNALGLQLMTLSAHKIYGPKGIGALVVDKSIDLQPIVFGGRQEKGLRAGTENVAAIVGFGKAAEIAITKLAERKLQLTQLRNYFEQCLAGQISNAVVFGQAVPRLPNTSFFAVPGIDGETLLMSLDVAGVAVSSGSACESASTEPSHVLTAMGIDRELARGAIRVSLGIDNTLQQISQFVEVLKQCIGRLTTMAVLVTA